MKKKFANIIIKLLSHADNNLKIRLFDILKETSRLNKYNEYREKYSLSESFRFNGIDILLYGKGEIICGENSYIGNYSTIQADESCKVIIGNNCSISHNVRIYTSSNIANQNLDNSNIKDKIYADVVIANGVWIGANVFITPGVTIGDNAIIGANSVVTKNIASDAIFGGVPAKLIKMKSYEK